MKNDRCPICGKNLIQKNGSVTFPTKPKKVTVENLDYQECVSCHEKVFSYETQQRIEQVVYGKKGKQVA